MVILSGFSRTVLQGTHPDDGGDAGRSFSSVIKITK
jgi:hypothetical protein